MTKTKTLSKVELAAALHASRKAVQKHLGRAGAPAADESGRYRLQEVRRYIEGARRRPASDSVKLTKARLRRVTAAAVAIETSNRVRSGELLEAAAVHFQVARAGQIMRDALMGMGATLAPRLEGKPAAQVRVMVDDAVRRVLRDAAALLDTMSPTP